LLEKKAEAVKEIRGLRFSTPLPLGPLIPASLADAGLEVRRRGLEVLAYHVHGAADFVAVCVHYKPLIPQHKR
jgi:hypothetical protein